MRKFETHPQVKQLLESIVKVLNLEVVSKGIGVNIISKGVIDSSIQQKSGMSDDEIHNVLAHFSSTYPINRIAKPKNITSISELLFSHNSLVLRNEKIIIDGGTTM